MEILVSLGKLPADCASPILTIGSFDGLHLGHQQVLRAIVAKKQITGGTAIVLTFDPHPQKIVSRADAPPLLQTSEQQEACLRDFGIDYLVKMPFTPELSRMSPEDFVRRGLLVGGKRSLREVHVGANFRFGRERSGDLYKLRTLGRRYGFEVVPIAPVSFRGSRVSSTRIRRLLMSGRVSLARRLLGRPYQIRGVIVAGASRGREMGFPTANIESPNELVPRSGVYVGRVRHGVHRLPCVTNVGIRPTFEGSKQVVVECHILDFEGDLYGENLGLEFLFDLRSERKFAGPQELSEQITRDVLRTRRYFERVDCGGEARVAL